jgi:hypothetical protein
LTPSVGPASDYNSSNLSHGDFQQTHVVHPGRAVMAATDPDGITASDVVASGAGVIVAAGEPSTVVDAVLRMRSDGMRSDAEAVARLAFDARPLRKAVLDNGLFVIQSALTSACSAPLCSSERHR